MFVWVLKHPGKHSHSKREAEPNVSKECDASWELSHSEVLFIHCDLQLPSVIHMQNIYQCEMTDPGAVIFNVCIVNF